MQLKPEEGRFWPTDILTLAKNGFLKLQFNVFGVS